MPQNRDFSDAEVRSLTTVAKVLYARGGYTSQEAFGEALGGLHQTSVSMLLRGKLGLRRSTAERIATLAGSTVEAILGREEAKETDVPALAAAVDVLKSTGREPHPGVLAVARVRSRESSPPTTAGEWASWIEAVTPQLAPFFSREWAEATLRDAARISDASTTVGDQKRSPPSTVLKTARPSHVKRGK